MIIRKATLSDVNELVEIWKQFVKEHSSIIISKSPEKKQRRILIDYADKLFDKWVRTCIRSRIGFVAVAEENKKIIGYTLCRIKRYDKTFKFKHYGSINDIFVIPNHRGKGVASKLKDYAIEWFKQNKIKHVALSFNSENSKVYEIYQNWGFKDEQIEMWKEI